MTERKKPIPGELWRDKTSDFVFCITKIGKQELRSVKNNNASYPDWVWWDNLEKEMEGNASLKWFKENCEKIS